MLDLQSQNNSEFKAELSRSGILFANTFHQTHATRQRTHITTHNEERKQRKGMIYEGWMVEGLVVERELYIIIFG